MNIKTLMIASVLALSGCDIGMGVSSNPSLDPSNQYASNGERIYITGIGSNGQAIVSQDGYKQGGMHRQMHGGGCASCHGVDRTGRRLYPRFWIKAPALTARSLFSEDEHAGGEESGHGDHASYDNAALRRAITDGIDPSGTLLNSIMPRWSMSDSDMEDLIAYLNQ